MVSWALGVYLATVEGQKSYPWYNFLDKILPRKNNLKKASKYLWVIKVTEAITLSSRT